MNVNPEIMSVAVTIETDFNGCQFKDTLLPACAVPLAAAELLGTPFTTPLSLPFGIIPLPRKLSDEKFRVTVTGHWNPNPSNYLGSWGLYRMIGEANQSESENCDRHRLTWYVSRGPAPVASLLVSFQTDETLSLKATLTWSLFHRLPPNRENLGERMKGELPLEILAIDKAIREEHWRGVLEGHNISMEKPSGMGEHSPTGERPCWTTRPPVDEEDTETEE